MLALPQAADDRALAQRLGRPPHRRRPRGAQGRYFINSILMVVPAVLISTMLGALNGYVLTKWRFPGSERGLRADAVRLLHPVPDRADPDGARCSGIARHRVELHWPGLVLRPRRLRPRLHHAVLPQLLRGVPDRAGAGGADRRRQLLPDLLAHPAADLGADHRRHGDLAVHQHLERLPVRRLVRRPATAQPMTVALNNLVNSSTGREGIQRALGRRDPRRRCRPSSSTSSPAATSCAA